MLQRTFSLFAVVCCVAIPFCHSVAVSQESDSIQVDRSVDQSAAKPFLGLHLVPVPKVLSMHLPKILGDGTGALILDVAKGSPAADAGIESNDILLQFGGQIVTNASASPALVAQTSVGQPVQLNLVRNGKPLVQSL